MIKSKKKMPKILLQLYSQIWKEPKKYVIELSPDSIVGQLLKCPQVKDITAANNFSVTSIKRFDPDFNEYIDLTEADNDAIIENMQKFEIFFEKQNEKFAVTIIVEGFSECQLELSLIDIHTVNDMVDAVIQKQEYRGMSVEAVKNFDFDFAIQTDIDDFSLPFDKKNKYFIYLKDVLKDEKVNYSMTEKPKSCVVHENPANQRSPQREQISPHSDARLYPLLDEEPHVTTFPTYSIDTNISSKIQIMDGEKITRQALGRIAMLGDLYDAHTDCFCSRSLFNYQIPDAFINDLDTERTKAEFVFKDSISEKFEKLNIEAELQASFVAGLIKVRGHGKYLSTKKTSARESSGSLVCNMETKFQSINVDTQAIIGLLTPESVQSTPNATHVVVGIQWGAVATATLTSVNDSMEDKKNIDAALEVKLKCIKTAAAGSGTYVDDTNIASNDFSLDFYMDALPSGDKLPQTVEEAIEFMRKLPALIKNANNGRGTPISYELLPLSAFRTYLNSTASLDSIIQKVDEVAIRQVVSMFETISESQQLLNDLHSDLKQNIYCLKDNDIAAVTDYLHRIQGYQTNTQGMINEALVNIRYGRSGMQILYDIVREYYESDISRQATTIFMNSLSDIREKIAFAISIQKSGGFYIGRDMLLEAERIRHHLNECYVFFCNWEEKDDLGDNKNLFYSLMNQKDIKCFLVDLSVNPEISKRENVPSGNRICHYENHQYLEHDVLAEYKRQKSMCLAKCIQERIFSTTKPNKRVILEIPCPRSIGQQKCAKIDQEWFCNDCHKKLEYCFNNNFICDCGSAPANTFQFRCSAETHGGDFIGFSDKTLVALLNKIRPYKQINILILGETGVGKSTWINGFANYLTYSTLEEAENSPQICLIPAKFTFKNKEIRIGESKNECFETGESSTQEPRSHVFNVGKKTVRLIDTPGIGDARGQKQDDANFVSILRYVSNIEELHGICILLKPNNARLGVMFKYCINELLTHLHKTAADNIVFCFTNARSTFYEAGDTQPALEKHLRSLDEKRGVNITLAPPTTYYMDNEAFRFLCCVHAGEKSVIDKRSSYAESWNISVAEITRLFKHFEEITPHVFKKTVNLNQTRQLILTLAKPLADVTQNIQDNINQISAKKREIETLESGSKDLTKKLKIPHPKIVTEQLGFPRTVCTNGSCVDTKRQPNTNNIQIFYKTICHDRCYLDNVVPEHIPDPALQKCSAMNHQLNCKICSCPWSFHTHITFKQETTTIMVDDPNIQKLLSENHSERDIKTRFIETMNERVKQYTEEQKVIDDVCAQFGAYLKDHAILPYNDTVEDYLKINITEAERVYANTKDVSIKQKIELLQSQLSQYIIKKDILDKNLKSGAVKVATEDEIKKLEEKLSKLPLTGPEIIKLLNATNQAKEVNFQYNEEFFDPGRYSKPKKTYLNKPGQQHFVSGQYALSNKDSSSSTPWYKKYNPLSRHFFE